MKIQADIKTQACAADFNEDTGSRRHQGKWPAAQNLDRRSG
jgi:hypothetical protein